MAKFKVGDLVRVNVNPKKTWKRHFETGFEGLVIESDDGYGVEHPKWGGIWWYDDDDLLLLKKRTNSSELKARRILGRD